MPDSFSIRLTRDDVTMDIKKKLGKVQNPQKLLRSIGTGLVGLAIIPPPTPAPMRARGGCGARGAEANS